ncbi:MAG: hypothetical protein H7839_04005 [Magnetococcus sp. YQC-5]
MTLLFRQATPLLQETLLGVYGDGKETQDAILSVRANRRMKVAERNALLRPIESTPFSGQCGHSRPTDVELTLKVWAKLFGRCCLDWVWPNGRWPHAPGWLSRHPWGTG